MEYIKEINPFFEACVYLSQRLTHGRTSDRIQETKQYHSNIPNEYWMYCERIAELERMLDTEFEPDELMNEYFFPLNTKDIVEDRDAISIGSLLLRIPVDGPVPRSIDEVIEYYRNADTASRFIQFGRTLKPFIENTDDISNLSGLVAAIDGIIVSPEDKWRIIDAVTDPADHIEKMRPLICAVAERIEEAAKEFAELLDECYRLICNSDKKTMDRLFIFDDMESYGSITVMPSLLFFNIYSPVQYQKNRLLIILGVFVYRAFIPKEDSAALDQLLFVIKTLSDLTRLRVLHDLCDSYSYGQKLAEQYNSTPNALYYHLDKLLSCGLVEVRETEYRTLYTMNKYAVYDNLTNLRDYLLNGWLPEYARELTGIKPEGDKVDKQNHD